jgi:hypothetical protein
MIIAAPQTTHACLCGCWYSPEVELELNTLVFLGTVSSVDSTCGCAHDTRIGFEVQQGFKGVSAGDSVEVLAGNGGGDCGIGGSLSVGDELVIFTDLDDPFVGECTPHVRIGGYSYRQCATDTAEGQDLTDAEVLLRLESATKSSG